MNNGREPNSIEKRTKNYLEKIFLSISSSFFNYKDGLKGREAHYRRILQGEVIPRVYHEEATDYS